MSDFTPGQLLALIQSLAMAWATMNPEFASLDRESSRGERRRAVTLAVVRVVGLALPDI